MSKNFVTKAQLKERYKEANDKLRQKNYALRLAIANNDAALIQISEMLDAILANVIDMYGTDGSIEIQQPDVSKKRHVTTVKSGDRYIISLSEQEDDADPEEMTETETDAEEQVRD